MTGLRFRSGYKDQLFPRHLEIVYAHDTDEWGFAVEETPGNIVTYWRKHQDANPNTHIYSSDISPTSTDGVDGDYWINNTTREVSQKVSGSWSLVEFPLDETLFSSMFADVNIPISYNELVTNPDGSTHYIGTLKDDGSILTPDIDVNSSPDQVVNKKSADAIFPYLDKDGKRKLNNPTNNNLLSIAYAGLNTKEILNNNLRLGNKVFYRALYTTNAPISVTTFILHNSTFRVYLSIQPNGDVLVEITGAVNTSGGYFGFAINPVDASKIVSIDVEINELSYHSGTYKDCINMVSYIHQPNVYITNALGYNGYVDSMFENCTSLSSFDLSIFSLYASSGGNLSRIFFGCTSLSILYGQLVITMMDAIPFSIYSLFENCTSLTIIPPIIFETVPNPNSLIGKWSFNFEMNRTFAGCTGLVNISLNGLVENHFANSTPAVYRGSYKIIYAETFIGCVNLSTVSDTFITQSLSNPFSFIMKGLNFMDCTSLSSVPRFYQPDGSVYNVLGGPSEFENCTSLTTFGSEIMKMYNGQTIADNRKRMFFGCVGLTIVDLTYLVIHFPGYASVLTSMFEGCVNLRSVNGIDDPYPYYSKTMQFLAPLDSSYTTHPIFDRMFFGCTSLRTLPYILDGQISRSGGFSAGSYVSTFENCASLELPMDSQGNLDTTKHFYIPGAVYNTTRMFWNCPNLISCPLTNGYMYDGYKFTWTKYRTNECPDYIVRIP